VIVDEVAVTADAVDATDQRAKTRPGRGCGQRLEIAGRDDGGIHACHRAHPDALAVEERAAAALRPRQLAVRRRAGNTEHEAPAAQQRDLRGEERAVAHEALGAVDRIHEPDALGIHVRLAGLLAVETVSRETPRE